jgi:putative NIF3 family GTP cyclohydrolase 1 type 2
MGRLVHLETPQPLTLLIERIAVGVGRPAGFPVAIPQSASVEDIMISRIGICPGSGGSVLGNCEAAGEGGLLFTGELAHHESLAVVEKGGCVVALGHSNSERGYLGARMREKVLAEVTKEWARVRKQMAEGKYGGRQGGKGLEEMWRDGDVRVDISERDRDPFGIVILQQSGWP